MSKMKLVNPKQLANGSPLNKVVLENVVVEKKVDNRTNNPGRPVNKKSARYKRLAKQAFYNDVNNKFVTGNLFKVSGSTYYYSEGSENKNNGCIVDGVTNMHVCNVSYIGRTKVQGYTFTLGKKLNIELNLKTLQFVK